MGKRKAPRREADNEASSFIRNLRVSPRKLNLLAGQIRGKPAQQAITELTFSSRRIAGAVRKALESAVANAENNHQLDVDQLVVAEAVVGKSFVMKRFRPRARGRASQIKKPFSNLRVVVREMEEA